MTETWIPNGGGAADNIITHSYDANGNRLTVEDENGAYTMTYDALNRVETFEDMWGSLLTFGYDKVGNRTLVEDSEGGVQTSTYDAASNLTRKEFNGSGLTPLRIDFTYNGNNANRSIRSRATAIWQGQRLLRQPTTSTTALGASLICTMRIVILQISLIIRMFMMLSETSSPRN